MSVVQALGALSGALNKILDPALRSFAQHGDPHESRSVIVELAAPVKAPLRHDRELPRRSHLRGKGKPEGTQALTRYADLLDELQALIADIVPRGRVRLDSAEAFVLQANPGQLRALSELKLVGSVRPNRIHRV